MRIEGNMTSELDGKILTIKWKNNRIIKELSDLRNKLIEKNNEIKKKEESGDLDSDQAEAKREDLLAEFYRGQCDAMFQFEDGTPDVEWFKRDDFPVGQMEFLRQVFTNPQIQT